jgi:regulator of protease activity HflC (stomatin/prohibitin superfamily)
LPFPVEGVELVDFSQVKTIEIGYRNSLKSKVDKEAVMLTDDENIIDIQFAVQYNIKDAFAYVFNNRKPDQIAAFVAESAIREVVGKAKMDFVLYEGREQIAKQTEQLMQQMLDRYGTGYLRAESDATKRAAAGQGAGCIRRRSEGRARIATDRRMKARPTRTTSCHARAARLRG